MERKSPVRPAGYWRELRRRRRAQGLCAEPGCRKRSGDAYRCPQHTSEYEHRKKVFRVKRAQKERLASR